MLLGDHGRCLDDDAVEHGFENGFESVPSGLQCGAGEAVSLAVDHGHVIHIVHFTTTVSEGVEDAEKLPLAVFHVLALQFMVVGKFLGKFGARNACEFVERQVVGRVHDEVDALHEPLAYFFFGPHKEEPRTGHVFLDPILRVSERDARFGIGERYGFRCGRLRQSGNRKRN